MCLTLLASCGTNKKATEDDSFRNEYIFIDKSDSVLIYAVIQRIVPLDSKPMEIEKVTAMQSGTISGNEVQSAVQMENFLSGNYPVSATEKMCTFVFKGTLFQQDIDDMKFAFYGATNYGKFRHYSEKTKLNINQIVDKNQFLRVIPVIEEKAPNTLVFKALAIRQFPHQGAYMPSSENFRIIITNSKDGKKWNSSEGMMFMQIIGSVEPVEVGTDKIYSYEYLIDQKKFRLNGQNTVEFIIPAMPHPIINSLQYWKR
jgi:hypothetical protein